MRAGFLRTAARAGITAGLFSGIPSTVVCVVRGQDPLEATAAAGAMILPDEHRQGVLVAAAIPVHAAISLGWALVLTALLPARRTLWWGAAAGLAIAALDLGPLSRPFPRIRALPLGPQIADHIAFGAIVAACVRGSRRTETGSGNRRLTGMTDNHTQEPSPEGSASEGSHHPPEEGSAQASRAEKTVAKMEKGIENVDDEIHEAKEKAEEAERFDPRSQTSAEDEEPPSQTSAEDGEPNTNG